MNNNNDYKVVWESWQTRLTRGSRLFCLFWQTISHNFFLFWQITRRVSPCRLTDTQNWKMSTERREKFLFFHDVVGTVVIGSTAVLHSSSGPLQLALHHHVLFHHLLVPPLPTFSFLIRRQTHVVRFLSLAVSAFFFRFSLLVFAQFLCAPTTHAPFTSNALLIWILPADELTSLLKLEETCRGCKWDTFQLLVYTKRKSPPTYRGITPGACTPFSFACGH